MPSFSPQQRNTIYRRWLLPSAALLTIVTFEMLAMPSLAAYTSKSDPLRLIEAVTAGVAFLAAGTIFTSKGQVNGLTTGAGMWMAGAIGLACGTGHLPLAAMATLVALLILSLASYLTRRIGATPPPAA